MSKHSSVLFYHIRVWEFPKMDFCEKLIFTGLGTHRLCLLASKINLSEIGVLLMCPDSGFAC